MQLDSIIEKLKVNGYKITEQRKAILKVLVDHKTNLISIDQIYSYAKLLYDKTNKSTVYRNLEILEFLNLVVKIIDEKGIALYKIICSEEHHHHLICKQCGKTQKIDFCPIDNMKEVLEENDFQVTSHKLELYGYCKKCGKKEKLN